MSSLPVRERDWGLRLSVAAALALSGALIYLLGPVLMPFLFSAILAYMGNPLVERLARWRVPRTLGVAMVFVLFFGVAAALMVLIIPVLQVQAYRFVQHLPGYISWVQNTALPALGIHLPAGQRLDIQRIQALLTGHWTEAGGLASEIVRRATSSGLALFEFAINLFLIPVVTFYLMRDWKQIGRNIHDLLPRRWAPTVLSLVGEADETLAAFVRGQLLVMLVLAVVYSAGLWIAGLDFGLVIGVASGLIDFVPYLGFVFGIVVATIASLVQTHDATQLIMVAATFGIGKLLEDMVLVPMLVGDRVGLHPVAVIFALLAWGQLFGFVGVLLAVPVTAVLAVLWRYLRRQWVKSNVYGDGA